MLEKTGQSGGEIAQGQGEGKRDDLLACLRYVAHELGQPFSAQGVLNGLPLRSSRLSVDLFPRAAQRLGLEARVVARTPSTVPGLVVPYIVLLRDGTAAVVTAKKPDSGNVMLIVPGVSEDPREVSFDALDAEASGHVIYVTRSGRANGAGARGEGAAAQQRPAGAEHWLWSRVRKFWPSWTQVILAALFINLVGLALPLFVMNVYDRVIPNLAIPTLWALAAGVVLALLFDFALKLLRALVLDHTGRRVDMAVAASLFEQALDVAMAERKSSTGLLANQIREFEQVRDFFTSSSIIALTDLLFIGVFITVLWVIVGPIAWVPLIAVPLVIAVTLLVQLPLAASVEATQREAGRRHSILVESLGGAETIKAVCGEGVMQRRWEDAVAATARANSATRLWSSLALYFTAFVQQAVSVVIIVWGVFLVSEGEISVGGLIAANILAGRVLAPLGNITMTLARAQQAFTALRGITAFMGLKRDKGRSVGEERTIRGGDVVFDGVSFTYPGASAPALSDISFAITAGERVGVVGRIGSGKSTTGKLLAGLYDPDRGSISIDGVNIQRFSAPDLRAGVTYLGQDVELFAGTLRENILLV
ncbi:MAG: ATP-binding cassette domain-containing protein, partial [Alphaproteobacteria bacterium]